MVTAHCLSMSSLAHSGRATPKSPPQRILAVGRIGEGAGTFYVWQTDGDLLTLRAHSDTCCSGRDGMPDRQRGAEQFGGERVEQTLTAADLGESSQRAATRIADGVRSFAPAPLQDDMAIVVVQVTPAAASKVAT
jgi:hypothetical protein